MKFAYEPYILRRFAENRILFVNHKMPFDCFVDCFHNEQPFFIVSMLEDGRITFLPNPMIIPINLFTTGFWPRDLFPQGWEYVTIKNGIYPAIMTAHPVAKMDEWFRKFERLVMAFTKETLSEYITSSGEFFPIDYERFEKIEKIPKVHPVNA
ncbi:MAG TPA: hypothetical protein VMV81_12965 [Phycisphaerae bacterium]|nr:hypothetical protein [Phycisphaerae bacterium]